MPYSFNRTPRGLLGLLDAKVQGRTPQELAEIVQPMLDMFPLWNAQLREAMSGQTAAAVPVGITALANGTLTGPPADELWYVEQYTVKMDASIAAGQHVVLSPALIARVSGAAAGIPITLAPPAPIANQIGWIASNTTQRPLLLIPGDVLGVWIDSVSGLATTVTGLALVSRLKI